MSRPTSQKRALRSLSHNDAWLDYAAVAHTLNLSDTIFTCTTRVVRRASEQPSQEEREELSDICNFLITFLFKSKNFTSALEIFEFNTDVADRVSRFPLRDWSFIIALFLLTRKMHTACTSNELKPNFQYAYESCAVAEQLAKAMPEVSVGEWLFVATIRPLSLLLYALRDTELLVQHRRKLSSASKSPFDIEQEIELFGLPHPALCQIIAQRLGLGVTTAQQLRNAFDLRIPLDTLDEKSVHFRAASMWLDALLTNQKPPAKEIAECFSPSANDYKQILSFVQLLKSEGAVGNWLDPRSQATAYQPEMEERQLFDSPAQEVALKHMLEEAGEDLDI
jgi:hypothetical protein